VPQLAQVFERHSRRSLMIEHNVRHALNALVAGDRNGRQRWLL